MGTTAQTITPESDAMVRGTARGIAKQLRLLHALDDLIAYGFEGLAEALAQFDPSRGVPFNGFAYKRVRGRILYGAQHVGGMSRKTYARAMREIDTRIEEAAEAKRDGPPREAEEVGTVIDDLFGQAAGAMIVAQLADEQVTPETKLIHELDRARVRRALARVPDPERALLRARYFEDRVLEDIGRELGKTESWASRTHTRALGMLREALG